MKFKHLTIHNILSIESAEIDFEGTPLADEPLFLITGETGAGKSTILDAISLALYGRAPRMSRSSRSEKFFSPLDEELPVGHISQMMRRHTGESEAILAYEGNDGRVYTASWRVRRARGRADGNLQRVVNTITDVASGTSVEKAGDLREILDATVGLTYEQFCRTSMLAQGEFTRFLYSEPNEKAEILEKLTGTEIYSEIGKRIYDIRRDKQTTYEMERQKLGKITLLTPGQREEIEGAIAQQELQVSAEIASQRHLQSALTVLQEIARTAARASELSREVERLKTQMQSDDYVQEQRLVADYRCSESARTWFRQAEQGRMILQELAEQEMGLRSDYMGLLGMTISATMAYEQLIADKSELTAKLTAHAPHVTMYERSEVIVTQLRSLEQMRKDLKQSTVALSELNTREACLKSTLLSLTTARSEHEQALEALSAQLTQLQISLAALKPEVLLEEQRALSELSTTLVGLDRLYTTVALERADLEKHIAEQAHLEEEIEVMQKNLPTLREIADSDEKVYNTARLASSEAVNSLRGLLSLGDVCPVCGQTIDHDITEHAVGAAVRPLWENWQKSKEAHDDLLSQLTIARTRKSQIDATVKDDEQRVQSSMDELTNVRATFGEDFPEDCDAVQAWYRRLDEEQRNLDQRQSEINNLQKQVDGVRTGETTHREELKHIESTLQRTELEVATTAERIQATRTSIEHTSHDLETLTQTLTTALSYPDAPELLSDTLPLLVERIEGDRADYIHLTAELSSVEDALTRLDNSLAEIRNLQSTIHALRPTWDKEVTLTSTGYSDTLHLQWRALERRLSEWQSAYTREQSVLQDMEKKLEDFVAETDGIDLQRLHILSALSVSEIAAIADKHGQLTQSLTILTGQIDEVNKNKSDAEMRKTQMQITLSAEELVAQNEQKQVLIRQLSEQISESKLRLKTDQSRREQLEEIRSCVERAAEELQRWNGLSQLFGDARGSTFRAIAQSYILAHLLHLANNYLRHFSDRYILTCSPGSLAILVTDTERGFAPQSINVLSGGESFMVSLALALALSGMSGTDQNLDLLFIDEGFGTLDSTSLSTVMDTLETLHLIGGRRVGIISHVQELKERIPTQISVQRVDPTRSVVTVRKVENNLQ